MDFWIRYAFLLLASIVLPFSAALWFDTNSEIQRAQSEGARAARLASDSLGVRLTLKAHRIVSSAISLSQQITDGEILKDLARSGTRKKSATELLVGLLNKSTPKGGHSWFVDGAGGINARNGLTDLEAEPQRISGHPVFQQTQHGFALDAFWWIEGKVFFIGAAPLIVDGRANGAVIIAQPIDRQLVDGLAKVLSGDVTVMSDKGEVYDSTLTPEMTKAFAGQSPGEPLHSGKLSTPFTHWLPVLPLLVDKHANGLAYTSIGRHSGDNRVQWVVSVPSGEGLRDLASRQEIVFGVMLASLMIAILIGLMNHRTFVKPIERVSEHLSEIQLGRGDLELPEGMVSKPFRRLVRLINMTVQKLPSRGLSTISHSGDIAPIANLADVAGGTGLESADLNLDDVLASATGPLNPPDPISAPEPAPPPPEPAPPPEAVIPDVPAPAPAPASAPAAPGNEEADAVAEAIASMNLGNGLEEEPTPPPTTTEAPPSPDSDQASAIAEAIASLESGLEAPQSPRSAAEIRGGTPGGEDLPSPFVPSQSEMLRTGMEPPEPRQDLAVQAPQEQPTGPRGGGSLALGAAGMPSDQAPPVDDGGFNPEATVVAPVMEDLLAESARDDITDSHSIPNMEQAQQPDMTVVQSVPADLLAVSAGEAQPADPNGLDAADHAHFKEVYERFIDLRRKCGEMTADLAFDRFLAKLTKNRASLIKKYNCRTVRFQVYEKDGKAALKATPVRAR